jgi:nucleoside-diphosphate-sugar epimerase
MKIFVAGATGALGKQLVPRLVAHGHEVTGTTRTEAKAALLSEMGATAIVVDALIAEQVADAVAKAQPDAIVHQLTALPQSLDIRHFDREF